MELKNSSSQTDKENISDHKKLTKVHGYLKHIIPKTLKNLHPYQEQSFKEMFHPHKVTVSIQDDLIPKMISKTHLKIIKRNFEY